MFFSGWFSQCCFVLLLSCLWSKCVFSFSPYRDCGGSHTQVVVSFWFGEFVGIWAHSDLWLQSPYLNFISRNFALYSSIYRFQGLVRTWCLWGPLFSLTSHSWYTPALCAKYAHPAPVAPRLAAHYGVSANPDLIETPSVPQASVSSSKASKSGVGETEYNPLWRRIPLPLQTWKQDRLLACKTQEWDWLWNPVLERPIQSRRTLKEERQQSQAVSRSCQADSVRVQGLGRVLCL